MKKVVITGGPSGGKTTLIEALKKEFNKKIRVAPEAASIIYKGGFPRIKSYSCALHAQRAICSLQRELEEVLIANFPQSKLLVCDRGSLDSLAYWPDTEEHFFENINSTRTKELARYDWVIHLDTAAEPDYDTSNSIRIETFQEALMLNEKIKHNWDGHPQRMIISSQHDFFTKMKTAIDLIAEIISTTK